jgi:hypothetical protein
VADLKHATAIATRSQNPGHRRIGREFGASPNGAGLRGLIPIVIQLFGSIKIVAYLFAQA